MQFACLQLTDVFDLVEATHECAVCHHLNGPLYTAVGNYCEINSENILSCNWSETFQNKKAQTILHVLLESQTNTCNVIIWKLIPDKYFYVTDMYFFFGKLVPKTKFTMCNIFWPKCSRNFHRRLSAIAPLILCSRPSFGGNYRISMAALFGSAKCCCRGRGIAEIVLCFTDEGVQRPGQSTESKKNPDLSGHHSLFSVHTVVPQVLGAFIPFFFCSKNANKCNHSYVQSLFTANGSRECSSIHMSVGDYQQTGINR